MGKPQMGKKKNGTYRALEARLVAKRYMMLWRKWQRLPKTEKER